MTTIGIAEPGSNLSKYSKGAQQGNGIDMTDIDVTHKDSSRSAVSPPADASNPARARLRELAETAVMDDVVSPTGEGWDAMG
uniref:Uncharacterized protein n=1 Tax=Candidatus Kentrum eta TaxID=2126337 RepID=A0A450V3R6_9GAMM|nr:MAG: hypothetical protein BECKH772A_GA0070896_101623 [Candidatus Kentron sp. H]VFK01562.1 MAG: hypothetical protein BECKH772B_GA0070898_102373 [Candidatus Kentron sp. H]VFK03982.1 MAG: hypothetical protein BECKH772C_GA0070978_101553 [Candidatus Kentron sp. H]